MVEEEREVSEAPATDRTEGEGQGVAVDAAPADEASVEVLAVPVQAADGAAPVEPIAAQPTTVEFLRVSERGAKTRVQVPRGTTVQQVISAEQGAMGAVLNGVQYQKGGLDTPIGDGDRLVLVRDIDGA